MNSRRRFLGSCAALAAGAALPTRAATPPADWLVRGYPFVRQPGGGYCYQACLAMALGHYFPQEKFAIPDLDRQTHHKPGAWTFEAQLIPPLQSRGLQVELHASTPYADLTPALAEKRYGPEGAQRLDFSALAWAKEYLKPGVFFSHEVEWPELAARFRAGWTVIFCVSEDTLVQANRKKFIGHSLLLTGLSATQAKVHDPARMDNMIYDQSRLAAAFASPGTDHACMFIRKS